jgi:hypothetical protein
VVCDGVIETASPGKRTALLYRKPLSWNTTILCLVRLMMVGLCFLVNHIVTAHGHLTLMVDALGYGCPNFPKGMTFVSTVENGGMM